MVEAVRFQGGKVLRETPWRRTRELRLGGGGCFYLKQYLPGGGRSFLGESRRERKAFDRIARLGISVPALVGWGARAGVGAFLLWKGCEGEPLDAVLTRGVPDPLGLGPFRAKKLLLECLADLVGRLHAAGFTHRDLYLCHVLYAGPEGRRLRLHLIDLQRVERRVLRRWYVKDVAALSFSAPPSVSRADRLRFLLRWLGRRRVDREVRRWVRSVLAKARRIASHGPRNG